MSESQILLCWCAENGRVAARVLSARRCRQIRLYMPETEVMKGGQVEHAWMSYYAMSASQIGVPLLAAVAGSSGDAPSAFKRLPAAPESAIHERTCGEEGTTGSASSRSELAVLASLIAVLCCHTFWQSAT